MVEPHIFAGILVSSDDYTSHIGVESSEKVWIHLKEKGYIDSKGKVKDTLRSDLKAGTISLPPDFAQYSGQIIRILTKVAGKLNVKNKDDKRLVSLKRAVLESDDFLENLKTIPKNLSVGFWRS